MRRKKRGKIGSTIPGINGRKRKQPLVAKIGVCWMLAASFFLVLITAGLSYGHIPEPGIIIYGKVYNNGTQLTSGEITWTFTLEGEDPFVVTAPLQEIDAEGGPYSYRVEIPLVSAVPGSPDTGDAIVLSDTSVEYTRSAEVTGTGLGMQDTVTIGFESRGTFENINIGTPPANDTDTDGLPDSWEEAIVTTDPNDSINDVGDVAWGDDADGDGESNWWEYKHGTDPTDASSTYNPDDAYTSYHFEIYRGAEQPGSGDPEDSFWGAKLMCWPRDGETFELGTMIKPPASAGNSPILLEISTQGDEARVEEENYDSLSDLMSDYVPGEYDIILAVNNGGQTSTPLWVTINIPIYTETNFPGYLTVESPQPQETGVSTTPLLDFSADTWDYVRILKADTRDEIYFHFRDTNDSPADKHQIEQADALEEGTNYILGLDTNDWGGTWLGSITTVQFTTFFSCVADMDTDGDVDGYDLALFVDAFLASSTDADLNGDNSVDSGDVAAFAGDYGAVGCTAEP